MFNYYKHEKYIFSILLVSVVIWSIFPIYMVLTSSFKVPVEIFGYPPTFFPNNLYIYNFINLFNETPQFLKSLINSGIISFFTMLLTVIVCLPAAYTFSRNKSSFVKKSAIFIIAIRMFPPLIISVPLYPVLNKLNLTDKHIVLILLYTTFEITIITLIMKSFIDSIPIEIEEAARLDGANISAIFLYIILPLSKPIIVTATILVGSYAWNDFQFGFLFTSSEARTTPVLIAEMVGSLTGVQWGNVFAACVIQFLPPLVFLWFIQKYLIYGLTSGSIR